MKLVLLLLISRVLFIYMALENLNIQLDKETKEELESISKLLRGQLRGVMNNAKANEVNLELIQITIGDVFIRGLKRGFTLGVNSINEKNITDELIDKVKSGLNDKIQKGDG